MTKIDWRPAWIKDTVEQPLGRRRFMTTSLAVGFAAAAQPVLADAITTDTQGIIAGEVKVPVADGNIPAYEAHPDGPGPFPTILVVQEIFGVHEYIQDVVRRFAKLGYFAIAPDLYARQGDPAKISDIGELLSKIVSKVPDAEVMSDLDATLAYAKTTKRANTAKTAITGFCWGGRVVWLYAAHNPHIKAGVAWYGMLAAPPWDASATAALSLIGSSKVPVLALYGGKDTYITADQIAQAEATAKGHDDKFVVYPEAGHGFHADYRPSYNKEAAEDGWKRLQAWFKKHGV
jgi:carboxymethylenebutenolidase